MDKLTKNTYQRSVNGKIVFQIRMGGKKFQECALCGEYFEVTGYRQMFCPDCAKKENSRKTSERSKKRYHAAKAK